MQNLTEEIKRTVEISDNDLSETLKRFQPRSFDKNDMLLSPGKVSYFMQFIQKGLIRVYYIDEEAKEITIQIGIENMWINDLYSFFTQKPGQYYIQALEPTTVLQIHNNDLEELYREIPIVESFIRLKIQRAYVALQDRTLNQLQKSAEERYLEFRNKYGTIESRVPQYMIASYLNITPEHLSKVRNKLAHT